MADPEVRGRRGKNVLFLERIKEGRGGYGVKASLSCSLEKGRAVGRKLVAFRFIGEEGCGR